MSVAVQSIEQHWKTKYAEVRARLFTPPPRPKSVLRLIDLPPLKPELPLWKQEIIRFNAHEEVWREMRSAPVKAYIKMRCRQMDIGYLDLMSGTRRRPIITVRHVLMFEVWKRFHPTYAELAKYFGLKDHATAIHAVDKFVKHGIHTFNRPEDCADVLKEMWIIGRSLRDMAAETGCAYSSINLYAKKQGWKRR